MPLISTIAIRLSLAAAIAAHDKNGRVVQPLVEHRPNCQLPEQVLRYLPSRQIAGPIASGTRGAVVGTGLSGFTGGSGEVNKNRGNQEVRQMYERTAHLPVSVELDGSQVDLHVKGFVPQGDSVEAWLPTGRLACAGSEVAA